MNSTDTELKQGWVKVAGIILAVMIAIPSLVLAFQNLGSSSLWAMHLFAALFFSAATYIFVIQKRFNHVAIYAVFALATTNWFGIKWDIKLILFLGVAYFISDLMRRNAKSVRSDASYLR